MTRPTLAVVHNNIDDRSSIGAIAAWDVREALTRGWGVTVVCRDLDPELQPFVWHLPLYVPPKLHLLQWAVARQTVLRALRGWRPDVLFVHQPQIAAIADVWNVHYLSRAAREARGPLPPGWKARVRDVQAAGVAALEDGYLQRLPPHTRILFCGDSLSTEFARLYGEPANARVLYNPALTSTSESTGSRPDPAVRRELAGEHEGPVIGFLGGSDPRKGGDLILAAMADEPDLFLVHAGATRLDDRDQKLRGRTRYLGFLGDVTTMLDGIDVLVVPSRFEPFGLVVAEASARGVPVLVTPAVGAAHLVVEHHAGAVWTPPQPLLPAVRALMADRRGVAAGGRSLAARLDPARLADERFAEIDAARDRNLRRRT